MPNAPNLNRSEWYEATVGYSATVDWDRTRHMQALQIERTPIEHDATPHPYTNWGYATKLAWTLANHPR